MQLGCQIHLLVWLKVIPYKLSFDLYIRPQRRRVSALPSSVDAQGTCLRLPDQPILQQKDRAVFAAEHPLHVAKWDELS